MKGTRAFIEIEMFSRYKYELNKDSNTLILDRPLNQMIPSNYGFVPETLFDDGDPLDVFVITKFSLKSGCECKIEVIGAFECLDQETPDHKLLAILEGENSINSWEKEIKSIETYLKTYKEGFKVLKQVDKETALQILSNSYLCLTSYK